MGWKNYSDLNLALITNKFWYKLPRDDRIYLQIIASMMLYFFANNQTKTQISGAYHFTLNKFQINIKLVYTNGVKEWHIKNVIL